MSLLKIVKKKTGFIWNPQPLRHSVQTVKDKSFHNSVDQSGLYLQVYIPSWSGKVFKFTVFRLLENGFVKLPRPWKDLIINPLCRTNPHKFFRKSLFPHLPWKVLLRKRSSTMEFCFGEFWQFNAFVMLKTSFSKHQVIKINMTCVCIKPEGKKKMSSQTDRSKVLDLRGEPPFPPVNSFPYYLSGKSWSSYEENPEECDWSVYCNDFEKSEWECFLSKQHI